MAAHHQAAVELLVQPHVLGLLQRGAQRGVVEQLGVEHQAQDSAHLGRRRTQIKPELAESAAETLNQVYGLLL